MTISFPNAARSYDDVKQRIRFQGYDGMFEVRFFLDAEALLAGKSPRNTTEREYLAAFDANRPKIIEAARKSYAAKKSDTITLSARDF